MDGAEMGLTHSWGLRVLRWDFLIAPSETLAFESPQFPSLYQHKGTRSIYSRGAGEFAFPAGYLGYA